MNNRFRMLTTIIIWITALVVGYSFGVNAGINMSLDIKVKQSEILKNNSDALFNLSMMEDIPLPKPKPGPSPNLNDDKYKN